MTNEEKRQQSLLHLKNYYIQIHLTVIYEAEFMEKLKSKRALSDYRDEILDRINQERRWLGYIK